MAQAVIEAYKMSKECHQEKLLFSQPAFAKGMDDTRKRIIKHYSNLNLDFLDENKPDNDVPTEHAMILEVEVVGNEEVFNAPPA